MSLIISGIEIPENLDGLKCIKSGIEKDLDILYVSGTLIWKKQKYYWIIYNTNGGNGTMPKQTLPVGKATALISNAFNRTGYLFGGWSKDKVYKAYNDGQVVTDIASAGQTMNLYALWQAITYHIDYSGNGATGGNTARSTHIYDVYKKLNTNGYYKTGYLFLGWKMNGTSYSNEQNVVNLSVNNGDILNMQAQWSPITYSVVYNANGADGGSTPTSQHTYDIAKQLSSNGYTASYREFLGWSTDGGSTVKYSNNQSVINLSSDNGAVVNLHATWKPTMAVNRSDACVPVTGGIARGNSDGEYADNAFWDQNGFYSWGYIPNGATWWICTKGMVDLTNIKTIRFRVNCGFNHNFTAGVTKVFGLNATDKSSYAKAFQDTSWHETDKDFDITLDVSDLTGLYHIQTQAEQDVYDGYASYQSWIIITLQ